mmetsp:Transcript_6172/g.9444  ORF Transcript_6172/g.9444 Transcript_6172/m.9444 type:complete len:109 (+) Transcript_6172:3145-3471(+)
MDYVPKKTRARWNSVDSITRFGWSGSAVVGGFLVDHYDYSTTFLVTAIMQVVASSLFFIIVGTVKIEPPKRIDPSSRTRSSHTSVSREPLLNAKVEEDGGIGYNTEKK